MLGVLGVLGVPDEVDGAQTLIAGADRTLSRNCR